jgi:phage shock protein PspC (stress-responsive transcriptional regulator)
MTRLYRSETDKILGGVCGGIAEAYDLDPSLVRLATVALAVTGAAEIVYLVAWLIIPKESELEDPKKEIDIDSEK